MHSTHRNIIISTNCICTYINQMHNLVFLYVPFSEQIKRDKKSKFNQIKICMRSTQQKRKKQITKKKLYGLTRKSI